MSYLRFICLFGYSGVQYILYCVFLRLVYHMSPVSLDCPFFIVPSIFSNIYLRHTLELYIKVHKYLYLIFGYPIEALFFTCPQILLNYLTFQSKTIKHT